MSLNMENLSKRLFAAIIAMLVIISTLGRGVYAETAKDSTYVDFVLVLDCSESMFDNDVEGWTAQAAEDFVNLIGTENVRLAVIAMGHDYGSDAYPVGQSDKYSRNKVKVAFPLTDATDEAREEAAKAIREVTSQKMAPGESETMTPIGYALQAAMEVLENGNSADKNAAIILLSDGQVDGQTDYVEKGNKKDFKSINEACDIAAEHEWPIYCMELNYNNENREGDGQPGVGYHQMRKNIPSKTGTEPFEVKSAEKAKEKLLEIYNKFFNNIETESGTTNVPAKVPFTVGEMTAEQTILLRGDVNKLDSIGLISPDGTKTETYKSSQGSVREKLRKIIFDDKSVLVKMVMPQEGEWILDLQGSGGVTLEYDSVSLKQMSLILSSDKDGDSDNVSGEPISFKAYFEYADIRYESADFFEKYPAVLHIGDQTVNMDGSSNGYEASYQFRTMGSYPTYAQVEAPFFKNGYIKSGEITFNVENTQTKAKGEVPEQTCGVNESTTPLDLSKYFDAGDDDDLTYDIKKSSRDDFEYDLSDDILVLKANNKSKVYKLTAIATDNSGEKGAEQQIVFRVTNKPLELLKSNEEQIELVAGAKSLPGIVLKLAKADRDSDTAVINWSEYFNDPDGAKPEIRVLEDSNDGVVDLKENEDGIEITALKAGKAEYTIVAIDGNADDLSQFVLLDIVSEKPGKGLLVLLVVALIGIGGGLFLVFGGRKIYGTWDINCNGMMESDINISSYKHGKGSTVEVNSILSDLGMDGGFSKACLKAGDQFGKKVFVRNFANMDSVLYNDIEVEDFRKKKEIEIKRGASLTLIKSDNTVTFTRVSG